MTQKVTPKLTPKLTKKWTKLGIPGPNKKVPPSGSNITYHMNAQTHHANQFRHILGYPKIWILKGLTYEIGYMTCN